MGSTSLHKEERRRGSALAKKFFQCVACSMYFFKCIEILGSPPSYFLYRVPSRLGSCWFSGSGHLCTTSSYFLNSEVELTAPRSPSDDREFDSVPMSRSSHACSQLCYCWSVSFKEPDSRADIPTSRSLCLDFEHSLKVLGSERLPTLSVLFDVVRHVADLTICFYSSSLSLSSLPCVSHIYLSRSSSSPSRALTVHARWSVE